MDANQIKTGLIVMGVVNSQEDLDWLTDEYIASQAKVEKEYPAPLDDKNNILAARGYPKRV